MGADDGVVEAEPVEDRRAALDRRALEVGVHGPQAALLLSPATLHSERAVAQRVDELVKHPGTRPAALMIAARTYAALGDLKTSEQLLRRAVTGDPSYGSPAQTAQRIKAPVKFIAVDPKTLALDLEGPLHQELCKRLTVERLFDSARRTLDGEAQDRLRADQCLVARLIGDGAGRRDPIGEIVLEGQRQLVVVRPNGQVVTGDRLGPRAVLSGSFNPVHDGHLGLAEVASAHVGLPVLFELPLRLLVGYAALNTAMLVLALISPFGVIASPAA